MVKLLTDEQLERQIRSLDKEWTVAKQKSVLRRTIKTANFLSAFTLVAGITVRAEVLQHHPDIELTYGQVKLRITTHDQGGLTKKDIQLAAAIDDVYRTCTAGDNQSR